MYTKFTFTDNDANVVDFLMAIDSDGYVCLTDVHYEIVGGGVDRPRLEVNGSWPIFKYYNNLLIYIEADVLADTSAHFNTFKIPMINNLMPTPEVAQTVRTQGVLTIHLDGMTNDWVTDVIVDSPPLFPTAKLSPAGGQMTMTFKSFRPYFHDAVADDYYWMA